MIRNVLRRKPAAMVVGFALVCLIVLLAVLLRPPTLEQVAREGMQAVEARDADRLLRQMNRAEIDALHLDRGKLQRYLDRYVGRRLVGFIRQGEPKVLPVRDSSQLIIDEDYLHPDGRKATLELTAAVTTEGPRLTSVIASLTVSLLMTDLSPSDSPPVGRRRHAFWGESLQKAAPELAATGVVGMVRQGTESGKDEIYTFEQFASRSVRLGAGASRSEASSNQ